MKVIKVGAEWCNGCLVMRPRWAEIERERPWLRVEYFDYDRDRREIEKYGIESGKLPVFILLGKNGKELMRREGEVEKRDLEELIEKYKDS